MSSPQPPQTEQTQTPAPEAQAPAAAPQQVPAARPDYVDPGPPEDRILSPQETENLLRGVSITDDQQRQADADDTTPDQQQMAQDFFAEIPPERTPGQMPSALPPAQAQVPGQIPYPYEQQMGQGQTPGMPTQQQIEQSAQQTQVGQTPGVPQAVQALPQVGQPLPPQQVPVQMQQSPEMAALQAQNQILQQQMLTMQNQMAAAQPQQAPPGRPGYQESPQQTYNFQVPPAYLQGIQSENPAEASHALNTLLNGVAETVTQQVRQEQAQLREEVGGMVRSTVSETGTQQEIQRDMYGTYPELAGHRDFVQAAARRLSQTMGTQTPWSPDLRDQIAEQVAPMVPGLYQKIQQVRAQRVGAYAVPQQQGQPQQAQYQQPMQQYQQPLPQQQQPLGLPPGVQPVGVVGGTHAPPPTLARDAAGNLVHVQGAPQPYLGSAQARQSGSTVPPDVMDIWRTLGYESYS